MPIGVSSGNWRPLRIAQPAVDGMPEGLRAVWDAYMGHVNAVADAKTAERAARTAAVRAPEQDRAAALAAARAGTDMPSATAPTLEDAADKATRNAGARIVMAEQAERAFLAALPAHRAAWRAGLTRQAVHLRDAALGALGDLHAEAAALSITMSARASVDADPRVLRGAGPGLTVRIAGQSVAWDNLVAAIRTALDDAAPQAQDAELAALAGYADPRVATGHRTFAHSLGD